MKMRATVALFRFASFAPLLLVVAFAACGKKKPPLNPEPAVAEVVADAGAADAEDAAPPKSLYDRLGGTEAIKAVVEKFVENVTQDPAVNKSFKNTKGPKLDAFKKNMVDQVCEVTGGPCKYNGKDMKTAHKGMKITEAQFEAIVMDLKLALGELKVPEAEQNELLEKLAPLKEDIVEMKPKPGKK